MAGESPAPRRRRPRDEHARAQLTEQRWELLTQVHGLIDTPLVGLSVFWLVLIIFSFTTGLSPLWQKINDAIWAIFVVDFLIEFTIAPHKRTYLRHHWLTAISLAVPAVRVISFLRVFTVVRALTLSESLSLVSTFGAINRGMSVLNATLRRRGVVYVTGIIVVIIFVGAAGMLSFESRGALRHEGYGTAVSQGAGFSNYVDALWWTAMLMTTMGSQYWPISVPGRLLCFALAVVAFSLFGYVTATIASHFVRSDQSAEVAQAAAVAHVEASQVSALRDEIMALRGELASLRAHLDGPVPGAAATSERPSPSVPD